MNKEYKVTPLVKAINWFSTKMTGLDIGPPQYFILSVAGRKTGKLYSTPVAIVQEGNQRWLVAPYGEVGWVRNARAAGQVTLSRGQAKETVRIEQVKGKQAADVLKRYVNLEPITRPYFEAAPDAAVEDFAAEADKHPVFRLVAA